MKTQLSESQIEEMKTRHTAGEKVITLAREFNIKNQRVSEICGKRERYIIPKRLKIELTEEQERQIFEMYYQNNRVQSEISRVTGLSRNTVKAVLSGKRKIKIDASDFIKQKGFKIPDTCTIYGLKGFADVDRKHSEVTTRKATAEELQKFEGIQPFKRPTVYQLMVEG